MLNDKLDSAKLTDSYQKDQRIRISNFLKAEYAERALKACLNDIPFSTHFVLDDLYQSHTPEQMAKIKPKQAEEIRNKIMSSASQGVGFLYQGYLKTRALKQQSSELSQGLMFSHELFDFISSHPVLELVKKISGIKEISSAEPQYTRYMPGHFLTRHKDVVPNKDRRIAFVLSFTKNWHPDWGGLLQFYENNGTPRDSWSPEFNSLTLFDVRHIHSVTYVTPFAAAPRLSLTGWFIVE